MMNQQFPRFYQMVGHKITPLYLRAVNLRLRGQIYHSRASSSAAALGSRTTKPVLPAQHVKRADERLTSGLARMPTSSLFRNWLLGTIFSHPVLWKPGFFVLQKITVSRSSLLNPDSNPVLRKILRTFLYDQFCAGANRSEILRTRDSIKGTGYSGVVLCYAKEAKVFDNADTLNSQGGTELEQWKNGTLETLDMIGPGDWIGIKFTGAGSDVETALVNNNKAPAQFIAAMHAVCEKAILRGCRIWIDAEQQRYQKGIDSWTVDLMRQYNRGEQPLVYNTIQAYLKTSHQKLRRQVALAEQEGWNLAIKLVRGAYMASDPRELIHDTKEDTDKCYNSIVRDVLIGQNLGFEEGKTPIIRVLLAGHNPFSIDAAWQLTKDLHEKNQLRTIPDFGQLQGMGDDLGCKFIQRCEDLQAERQSTAGIPKIYKCLTWGSVSECMLYLFRRAVENSGGTARMKDGTNAYFRELMLRLYGRRKKSTDLKT